MICRNMYVRFGAIFFFFFLSWSASCSLVVLWLGQAIHLSSSLVGFVFSINAIFSMVMQPLYGYITDKFGVRKDLLIYLSGLLIFTGPFFIYVYGPLLKTNFILGVIAGGLFLGVGYLGAIGAVESYIEKVSRKYDFEYGRVRLWGSLGWATATFFCRTFI